MPDSLISSDSISQFRAVKAVYCDSRAALAEAWRRGVPRHVPVWTSAPALLADPSIPSEPFDVDLTHERILALEQATLDISIELWRRLKDWSLDVAAVAARMAIQPFQSLVYKAASLKEEHFRLPIAVITVRSKDPALDQRFHSPLANLLASNPLLRVVEISLDNLPKRNDPRPPSPGLVDRLRHASLEHWIFNLALRLWGGLSLGSPNGDILVMRDNDFVRETAANFAVRGYAIRSLRNVRVSSSPIHENLVECLRSTAESLIQEHLGRLVVPSACQALIHLYSDDVVSGLGRLQASIPAWHREFELRGGRRPVAVLSNIPSGPEGVGLHVACRERGFPLILFQHGVYSEVGERIRLYEQEYEALASDLVITYNQEAADAFNASSLSRGRAVAVGMPSVYRQTGRVLTKKSTPAIYYVSTALYNGNLTMLVRGSTDRMIADFEIKLIDDVFSSLPHRILYKPYPGERYLDPDPVLSRAKAAANIEVYEGRLDLRYLSGTARLLITARATGTVGWCLLTGKPTVFIDVPGQMRLLPKAMAAFAQGLFLFDAGAPGAFDQLRDFLAQPLEEIERLWALKSEARAELIKRFFSRSQREVGRQAFGVITDYLCDRNLSDRIADSPRIGVIRGKDGR